MRRSDPGDWMWAEACDLLEQAERLHRRFFSLDTSRPARPTWEPPVDMYEDERELVVVVAMPGVPADRVQVSHEGATLVVRGERPLPFAARPLAVRNLEIPYGAFERRIPLPAGRFDVAQPELSHGCLVLHLRRTG
jgi:HSP20 family molecular chaperone IbpA